MPRGPAPSGRPPEQGDLTDLLYFDFISFAQYETINDPEAPKLFEELVAPRARRASSRGTRRRRRRSTLARSTGGVGDKVLDFVLERFAATSYTQVRSRPVWKSP